MKQQTYQYYVGYSGRCTQVCVILALTTRYRKLRTDHYVVHKLGTDIRSVKRTLHDDRRAKLSYQSS